MSDEARLLQLARLEPGRLPRTHVYVHVPAVRTLLVATLGVDGDLATCSTEGLDVDVALRRQPISISEVREMPDATAPTLLVASSLTALLRGLRDHDIATLRLSPRRDRVRVPAEGDYDAEAALEQQLCERDTDCGGGAVGHVWLCREPIAGDAAWCLWHLDRVSGNIVPPTPVLIEQ